MPAPAPRNIERAEYIRKVLIATAIVIVALALWKIAPVFILAFAGIVMATVLRVFAAPLARRTGLPDVAAVGIVTLVFLAILVGSGYLFGNRVAQEAQALWTALTEAWERFSQWVSQVPVGEAAMQSVTSGGDGQAMAKVAKGTFTVFGAVADVVLILFLAVYFASDPQAYKRGLLHLFPRQARDRIAGAVEESGIALRKWLVGQLAAMVAVGVLTGVGLWLVGVPLALPLAILSALLDFVPVIGPFVAAIPGVLIAFAQGPEIGLYAALVYFAVQFMEGNLIMPMAQKWAVSVPPALSLLGIVAFGLVFGLMGVLFAMPLLVVTLVLVQKLYVERIEK